MLQLTTPIVFSLEFFLGQIKEMSSRGGSSRAALGFYLAGIYYSEWVFYYSPVRSFVALFSLTQPPL